MAFVRTLDAEDSKILRDLLHAELTQVKFHCEDENESEREDGDGDGPSFVEAECWFGAGQDSFVITASDERFGPALDLVEDIGYELNDSFVVELTGVASNDTNEEASADATVVLNAAQLEELRSGRSVLFTTESELAHPDAIGLITVRITVSGIEDAASDATTLVDAIRAELAGGDAADGVVVHVVFHAEQWDNGYFFGSSDVTVTLADGTTERWEFEDIEELLAEASSTYGPLGRNAELSVDLLTGEVALNGQ